MEEEPEGHRTHIRIAEPADVKYVYPILKEMEASAKARGTGIARRTPQSLCQKIYEGKAVIALADNGDWAGFSYIESWGNGEFVSNSGLIVNPAYRHGGVARAIIGGLIPGWRGSLILRTSAGRALGRSRGFRGSLPLGRGLLLFRLPLVLLSKRKRR